MNNIFKNKYQWLGFIFNITISGWDLSLNFQKFQCKILFAIIAGINHVSTKWVLFSLFQLKKNTDLIHIFVTGKRQQANYCNLLIFHHELTDLDVKENAIYPQYYITKPQ